jgi:thioredoxin reductase
VKAMAAKYLKQGMVIVDEGKSKSISQVWYGGDCCRGMHVICSGQHIMCYGINAIVTVK